MSAFIWGIYLGETLLGHRMLGQSIQSTLADIAKQFSKMIPPMYTPTSFVREFGFLQILDNTW